MRRIVRLFFFCVVSCSALAALGQSPIIVKDSFNSQLVIPFLLKDKDGTIPVDSLQYPTYSHRFRPAPSPHLSFGYDTSLQWMRFVVISEFNKPRTFILRLNRKEFDQFELYQRNPADTVIQKLATINNKEDNERSSFFNGYYFPITLKPGPNLFYANVRNRIGSMHFGLSVHSQENFGLYSRQVSLLYGIFTGVMVLSLLFSIMLWYYTKDRFYLIYIAYVISICLREIYYSAGPSLEEFHLFQRHSSTMLIAATYAALFRRFLKVENISTRYNDFLRRYAWTAFGSAFIVWILADRGMGWLLKYIFEISNISNLLFITFGLLFAIYFRKYTQGMILVFGSFPLALAFSVISLRNLDLIPNDGLIQFSVMAGFILEVLIFTAVFTNWYRSVEEARRTLILQVSVEQKEKQMAIQVAEQRVKDRIARDLHDDVAASLSSIRILSQVARNQFEQKLPEAAPILEQINRTAQSTLDGIGDIIWAIKPHPDYLNDMADRMREYATKILGARDLDYQLDIPRTLPELELDVEARRNIYMIFKEAVNNLLKHSGCTEIKIRLSVEPGMLRLQVEDNGKGLDPEKAKRGHGLSNMHARAADIKGKLIISSEQGVGTQVTLMLPLGS
jgi:signal transduction histidine kinase